MDLSGTNQYAMVPAGMLASVTNFTIALWVNWDGGAAWRRIFDFGNGTTQYMFLTPDSGSGMLRFAISTNGDAPGDGQILETSPLPLGQWRHIAITRNGNTTQLYTTAFVLCQAPSRLRPPASTRRSIFSVQASLPPILCSMDDRTSRLFTTFPSCLPYARKWENKQCRERNDDSHGYGRIRWRMKIKCDLSRALVFVSLLSGDLD